MESPSEVTTEEYLAMDAGAPPGMRYEYDGLRAWALAGASYVHNRLTTRIVVVLDRQLSGCDVLSSDQRVRIQDHQYVYPDVVAVCDAPQLTNDQPPSLLNPRLVVEVLSASTELSDLGWKVEAYLKIDSLDEYWIVRVDDPVIHRYIPHEDGWIVRIVRAGGVLETERLGLRVEIDALYDEIES
jgi:Uma2 family endonuclease